MEPHRAPAAHAARAGQGLRAQGERTQGRRSARPMSLTRLWVSQFSKPKLEGWWLVVAACGEEDAETEGACVHARVCVCACDDEHTAGADDQLLALQRISLSREAKTVLKFKVLARCQRIGGTLTPARPPAHPPAVRAGPCALHPLPHVGLVHWARSASAHHAAAMRQADGPRHCRSTICCGTRHAVISRSSVVTP